MGELLVRGADTEALSSVTLRRADQVIPVRRLLFTNGSRTSPPAGPARPGARGGLGLRSGSTTRPQATHGRRGERGI